MERGTLGRRARHTGYGFPEHEGIAISELSSDPPGINEAATWLDSGASNVPDDAAWASPCYLTADETRLHYPEQNSNRKTSKRPSLKRSKEYLKRSIHRVASVFKEPKKSDGSGRGPDNTLRSTIPSSLDPSSLDRRATPIDVDTGIRRHVGPRETGLSIGWPSDRPRELTQGTARSQGQDRVEADGIEVPHELGGREIIGPRAELDGTLPPVEMEGQVPVAEMEEGVAAAKMEGEAPVAGMEEEVPAAKMDGMVQMTTKESVEDAVLDRFRGSRYAQ